MNQLQKINSRELSQSSNQEANTTLSISTDIGTPLPNSRKQNSDKLNTQPTKL